MPYTNYMTENPCVPGSIPGGTTTLKRKFQGFFMPERHLL